MWKEVAKKAGWKQNLVPTAIRSGPNLITNIKGVADVINILIIEAINYLIPRMEFDPITTLQQKMFRWCSHQEYQVKFEFSPVTEEKIKELLAGLSNTRSTGLDTIPVAV